jgi:hypothetical protein
MPQRCIYAVSAQPSFYPSLESKLANINAVLVKDPTWAFDRSDAD